MEDVIQFLSEIEVLFIATIGLDEKPHVRPIVLGLSHNNRLFFSAQKNGGLYDEIINNPCVELSAIKESMHSEWIRIRGEFCVTEDDDIKQRVFLSNDILKHKFESVANPSFMVFELINISSVIMNFSGAPIVISDDL